MYVGLFFVDPAKINQEQRSGNPVNGVTDLCVVIVIPLAPIQGRLMGDQEIRIDGRM